MIKLFNDDCFKVMKDIPDKSIDLILTDPPYGIDFCSSRTNRKERLQNDKFEDWKILIKEFLNEGKRILTDTGVCCCCCGGGGGKMPVTAIFTMEVVKQFNLIQTLVWKKFIGLGWKYRPAYENIVVFSKSKDNYAFYNTSKSCSNVIEGINQDVPQYKEKTKKLYDDHPTQKPVALMKRLLLIHTKAEDTVLDPFMGSGTTGVACAELHRNFIGIEINTDYYKAAEHRINSINTFDFTV